SCRNSPISSATPPSAPNSACSKKRVTFATRSTACATSTFPPCRATWHAAPLFAILSKRFSTAPRKKSWPHFSAARSPASPRKSSIASPASLQKAEVGVGIMIAHNPLHGSGQAGFPHPALALGDNAHAAQGIGMTDGRQRQPASDEAPHAIPEDASVLATPRQRAMPEPSHLESKESQRRVVHGHSVIPEVSTHHRLQPFALFGNGFVHPSSKLGFHLVQLRLQPFADRLPQHR